MSDSHEIRNLYDMPMKKPKKPETFARSVRAFWAPIGALVAIAGACVTGTIVLLKPFSGKADARSVIEVRRQVAGYDDRIDHLEQHAAAEDARMTNFEQGQQWVMQTIGAMALQQGVHPAPIPVPSAVPPVDPPTRKSP